MRLVLGWTLVAASGALGVACAGAPFSAAAGDGGASDSGGASSGASSSSSSGSSSGSSGGGSSSSGSSSGGSSSGSSSSGGSSGVPNDGGTDGGSDGGVSCPPAPAPVAGSSCKTAGLECEYGLSTVLGCNTLATCTGGAWSITPASAPDSGLGCEHLNGATCPPTLVAAAAPDAGTCSVAGTLCDYLTGRCECTQGSGGVAILVDAGYHWTCVDPGPNCPSLPRPKLGASCAEPSTTTCEYGSCAIIGGTSQSCEDGVWQQALVLCPPEAAH
jgi:hypothetical protein